MTSLQERLQLREDVIPNVVTDALQRAQYDHAPRWPFFVEAYMRGRLKLRICLGVRRIGECVSIHFSAVFERASEEEDAVGVRILLEFEASPHGA
jgi:hypothetical protein